MRFPYPCAASRRVATPGGRFMPGTGLRLLLAATAMNAGGQAMADPQPSKPSVEEVVVTAEKRAGKVQSTPISITALSGAELKRRGITDIESIVRDVPGLAMRTAGPGQTELELRGLASSGGAAPTVGYYLDETPLSPPAAANNGKVVLSPDLYDLNRVEVLRGPQGTLYGSGSMGGTVKLITNAPDPSAFYGSAEIIGAGTVGGGPDARGNLMLNLPLVPDRVALRIVGSAGYDSGWIDRIAGGTNYPLRVDPSIGELALPTCPGAFSCTRGNVLQTKGATTFPNVNYTQTNSLRGSLLARLTDDLTLTLNGMFHGITAGGYNSYDQTPDRLAHYQPGNLPEPFHDRFELVSAVLKYDQPDFDITASTSYWHKREFQALDTTEQFQVYFNLPFEPTNVNEEIDTSHQFSQELRVASKGEGRLNWVFGAFYSDLTSHYIAINEAPNTAAISVGGAPANPRGILFDSDNPYHISQYAIFGEASYRITDTVKFTAGVRYFDYNTLATFHENGLGTSTGNAQFTTNTVKVAADGFNPRFNLAWLPNHDLTVYATAAKGFRPGGANFPAPVQFCGQQPYSYGPDSVWNYEGGEKARLFGGDVTVNSDFYYIQWNGVQQAILPPCAYLYTENAGTGASYGPELEVSARLTDHYSFTFAAAQTTSKLVSVGANTGLAPGEAILNIPAYTASIAAIYNTDITDALHLTGRLATDFIGPSEDINYYRQRLKSYNLTSLRLTLERGDKSVAFFINNLFNARTQLGINNSIAAWPTASLTRVTTSQPMTIGLDLSSKF